MCKQLKNPVSGCNTLHLLRPDFHASIFMPMKRSISEYYRVVKFGRCSSFHTLRLHSIPSATSTSSHNKQTGNGPEWKMTTTWSSTKIELMNKKRRTKKKHVSCKEAECKIAIEGLWKPRLLSNEKLNHPHPVQSPFCQNGVITAQLLIPQSVLLPPLIMNLTGFWNEAITDTSLAAQPRIR